MGPDGDRAVLMRQGFEAVAAGKAIADVLARLTALGLLSKKGRPVRYQEFSKFLRNPFYKGVTKSGGSSRPTSTTGRSTGSPTIRSSPP